MSAVTPEERQAIGALLARPAVAQVFAALDGDGAELRLVGGAVRDALLGQAVDEIDMAVSLPPDAATERAQRAGLRVIPTGAEHGTITVLAGGERFEITSLREDVATDGRRAVVRFGTDFDADAMRRDFTINAMSVDGRGRLHDPAGGYADLRANAGRPRVRFIGDALTRIREDYLRILRFFRFLARFGADAPDPDGFHAAIRGRDGLKRLSAERVRAELLKLLAAPDAAQAVALMAGAGLLLAVSGVVAEPGRLARLIARQAREGAPPDPLLRLGALAVRVREDAAALQQRLRLSGAETARLAGMARAMEALRSRRPLAAPQLRALAAEESVGALADALAVLAPDGGAPALLTAGAAAQMQRFRDGTEPQPQLPLRGADVVALGVKPGPGVGAVMAAARRSWLADGCPTDAAARARLLALVRELAGANA
ncbi:CCA tRNA nucleotidyltransferase [Camelimonas abortus]|uniref:CCA tRNA nucleotidyltransferase n=1 Tax=Camelimonas abortus TaxID=1017184 RepID=UPI0035E6AF48